jgi:hypothetical protein
VQYLNLAHPPAFALQLHSRFINEDLIRSEMKCFIDPRPTGKDEVQRLNILCVALLDAVLDSDGFVRRTRPTG